MSGRAKLSRIIQVKPCHVSDEKNKENIDISPSNPPSRSPSHSPDSKCLSSLANSVEDVFEDVLQPPKSSPNHRRSRSLDRLPASGTSQRRNSYFDVTHTHTQSLGSPELPPVFTTTYNTIFSTITANNNNNKSVCMSGSRNYNNVSKKNLNLISDKFKTTELSFQKSPVRRKANW